MSKRVLVLAAAAAVVMGLAACKPVFPEGSELRVAPQGSSLVLGWDEPTVLDPAEPVREYVVFVDGLEVSRVAGFFLGCQLFGLEGNTTYTIGVRAIDEGNRASDILTTEVFTTFSEGTGPDVYCTLPED